MQQSHGLFAIAISQASCYIKLLIDKLADKRRALHNVLGVRNDTSCGLIYQLVSRGRTARWPACVRQTYWHCAERRVVMWTCCSIIVLVDAAWLEESFCRRGRVVVVVDCSAVECDHCGGQRPTRDLRHLTTGSEVLWRLWMTVKCYLGRLLQSPTHTDWLTK